MNEVKFGEILGPEEETTRSERVRSRFFKTFRKAARYIPFAEGPRNCVGQSLAKTNLVATLASLLPGYHFELDESMNGVAGVRAREQYTLVTGIDGGMMMRAIPRKVEGVSTAAAVAA